MRRTLLRSPLPKAAALLLATCCLAASVPSGARAQTCNGLIDLDYVSQSDAFGVVGSTYRARIRLGSGTITTPEQTLRVNRFRFELDCQNFAIIGCPNDGDIIDFVGNVSTAGNCAGVSFTPDTATDPNAVIFNASPQPLKLAANTALADGCFVDFDIVVANTPSMDASPNFVQQAVGFSPFPLTPIESSDAVCLNSVFPGFATALSSSQLQLAPVVPRLPASTPGALGATAILLLAGLYRMSRSSVAHRD